MLEYAFFSAEPCERFCRFAENCGLRPQVERGDPETVVRLDEQAVDDELADLIDAFYDDMFMLDQALFEEAADGSGDDYQAAGVVVNLGDGRAVYADVPPQLLGKVMQALSPEDLASLVAAIVDAVEAPDERTLCQRQRDAARPREDE